MFRLTLLKHIWKQKETINNLVDTIEEQQMTIAELKARVTGYKELLFGNGGN